MGNPEFVTPSPAQAGLLHRVRLGTLCAGRLIRETIVDLRRDPPGMQAAALAYYTAFSLGPIILLLVRGLGWLMGESDARRRILRELYFYAGYETAEVVKSVLEEVTHSDGAIATLIAIGTLGFAASRVFSALQEALNHAWDVSPNDDYDRRGRMRRRMLSFLMVVGAGVLLVTSMMISAALGAVERWFGGLLPKVYAFQVANGLLSFALLTLVFASIYRYVPDTPVRWSEVWVGAVVASLLFALGRVLLGLYFNWSALGSAYVAAGSVMAVLLWLYFSATILLVGARMTRIHAEMWGSRSQSLAPARQDERKSRIGMRGDPLQAGSKGGSVHGPT